MGSQTPQHISNYGLTFEMDKVCHQNVTNKYNSTVFLINGGVCWPLWIKKYIYKIHEQIMIGVGTNIIFFVMSHIRSII